MTSDCLRCDLFHRMILCPECGNKRCPKATWHGYDCTGSNEPNQPGSYYHYPTTFLGE